MTPGCSGAELGALVDDPVLQRIQGLTSTAVPLLLNPVCVGPGTAVAASTALFAGRNSPTCGYTYGLRSLPERTGSAGRHDRQRMRVPG